MGKGAFVHPFSPLLRCAALQSMLSKRYADVAAHHASLQRDKVKAKRRVRARARCMHMWPRLTIAARPRPPRLSLQLLGSRERVLALQARVVSTDAKRRRLEQARGGGRGWTEGGHMTRADAILGGCSGAATLWGPAGSCKSWRQRCGRWARGAGAAMVERRRGPPLRPRHT